MSKGTAKMTTGTISKAKVMKAAWKLFREFYGYGPADQGGRGLRFKSIGRQCFASCLQRAWAEERRRAQIAAIPSAAKAARLEILKAEMSNLREYCTGSYAQQLHQEDTIRREIRDLMAA